MRLRVILSLMTVALACFTVAVWSSPMFSEGRRPIGDGFNEDSGLRKLG